MQSFLSFFCVPSVNPRPTISGGFGRLVLTSATIRLTEPSQAISVVASWMSAGRRAPRHLTLLVMPVYSVADAS